MKLRRLLAAATAAMVAASVVTVTSSAANFNGLDEAGQYCLISNDSHVPALTDASLIDDIVGFKLTIKPQDHRAFGKDVADPAFWYGGGFGVNSTSNGWKSLGEWSFQDGAKDLTFKAGENKGEYFIEYTQTAPMFKANETYAFIWFQDWTGSYAIDVVDFDIFDADGNNLFEVTVDTPAEPTEEVVTPAEPTEEVETPAEPTEEPVEEPTEEPVESAEPTEEPVEEPTEEPVESAEPTIEAEPTEEPVEESTEEPVDEPVETPTTNTGKDSPETGVEGIAVALGAVALAGVAVVASRKRK